MKTTAWIPAVTALAIAAAWTFHAAPVRAAAETTRTVYMSAVDAKGELVSDLTAADLVVKENGQVRQVTGLVPATEQAHIALIVDDGGEGTMQSPVAELLTAAPTTPVSIQMMNPQALLLNDFTTDHDALQKSILRLVQRGRAQADLSLLSDAVALTARDLQKRKLSRPVIVVMTSGGESSSPEVSRGILSDLRESGAALHVIHVVNLQLGQVMVEGPVQSGGSSEVGTSTRAFADAGKAIVRTLSHQYKLTYTLPDGVKPSDRLQVTTTRKDVKVVAPTRISTKS
jgi:hypothetical protein